MSWRRGERALGLVAALLGLVALLGGVLALLPLPLDTPMPRT